MFNQKRKTTKEVKPSSGKRNQLLAQMGMGPGMGMDLSGLGMMPPANDDDDDDLEAELLALQGLGPGPQQRQPKPKPKAKAGHVGMVDLNTLGDEDDDVDDDDDDVDENDPELSAELLGLVCDSEDEGGISQIPSSPENAPVQPPAHLAPVPPIPARRAPPPPPPTILTPTQPVTALLAERMQEYEEAIVQARLKNDSIKTRRYERGLMALKDMHKQSAAGKPVLEESIPPKLATGKNSGASSNEPSPSEESRPSPQPVPPSANLIDLVDSTAPSVSQSITSGDHALLCSRRDSYKRAALAAKHQGDLDKAKSYFCTAKQFDAVIEAVSAGQPVDLSKMPPPAPEPTPSPNTVLSVKPSTSRQPSPTSDVGDAEVAQSAPGIQAAPSVRPAPASVLEDLQQRLQFFREAEKQAREAGNSSKARRNDRLAKQYEDAVKAHKAGKSVDYDELVTPPGFQPFPSAGASSSVRAPSPQEAPAAALPGRQADALLASSSGASLAPAQPARSKSPRPSQPVAPKPPSKHQEQLSFLSERRQQYKLAALNAKKSGDIEKAKEMLKTAKGFDGMIESLENGLRVDMSQVPPAPDQLDEKLDSFEFVEHGDCDAPTGDRDEMYKTLEQQLINQVRICTDNAHHFTQIGDIASSKTFEKLSQNCRMDLDSLKNAYQHNDPVPRFHYETKEFKIVQSCTDLGDGDVELEIIRGVNYNLPSGYSPADMDTYVKFEFPFPTEQHQEGKTDVVRGTVSPEYESTNKLTINRKSRALLRVVKIKAVKLEVYYKRGFLKGDKLLGAASLKLCPLEEKCVVHESIDLLDGRRPCGGRIEVKVRIREPLTAKQVEVTKEKWLIIDQFNRAYGATVPTKDYRSSSQSSKRVSMEVLRYEKKLLDEKIMKYESQLTATQMMSLKQKSQDLETQLQTLSTELRAGGKEAYLAYAEDIEKSVAVYHQEALEHMKKGNKDKAQISISKKKLVEKEVAAIRTKLPG